MNTEAWTKAEAKAADAILAELTDTHYEAREIVDHRANWVLTAAGARTIYIGRRSARSLDGHTPATVQDVLNGGRGPRSDATKLAEAIADYNEAIEARETALLAINNHELANYKGWQRYFLVPDGHIHASTRCSSLRPTTRIGWLPQLSGETEAEAVAAHGAMLCTKCFPTAPVEWTRGKDADPSQCEGGIVKDANMRLRSPYGTCPTCGQTVSVTSTCKARKHKKEA